MFTRKNLYTDTRKKTGKKILFVLLLLSAGFSFFFFTNTDGRNLQASNTPPPPPPAQVQEPGPSRIQLEPGPFQTRMDQADRLRPYRAEVKKGESLSVVIERLGLDRKESYTITQAMGEVLDVTKIRPGSLMVLYREKTTGRPEKLEFKRKEDAEPLVVYKTPAGYVASWHRYESIMTPSAAAGVVKGSLWATAVNKYGIDPEVIKAFADIFAYDVDFFTDIQNGDRFSVLYEQNFCRGKKQGCGRILAASFTNKGRKYEVYYWEDEKGNGAYYDEEGRSLKKMFLKSPLQYSRISSHFTYKRMHPILKYVRPHLGVDYAAPKGTPVEALGDGVVSFAGWKGGYGRIIIIRHGKKYETYYAHLNNFAKGIKKGVRVKQGQLIGFVGMTGLATGPHLDFRVKENGKFINPLSMKLQPSPPLPDQERTRFLETAAQRRAQMERLTAARR